MANSLTVREMFNGKSSNGAIQTFDPMDIDLSEIKELSNSLPKDGSIDINQAEILATKYLRGADLVSELLSIATAYCQKTETEKKKKYSEAALIRAVAAGMKTDKSKCLYAEMDSEFVEASNKHSEALAFLKWLSSKYDSLLKAHYLCKQMLARHYSHEQADSWNGSAEQDGSGNLRTAREAEKEEKNEEDVWW
ncbi:MAG: hypothetical protein WC523_03730 [Patescibacteria group bacterium]